MTIDKSLDPDRKQLLDTIVDNHRFVFGELHRVVLNLWALMTKVEERNWARNTISDECKGADVVALEALSHRVNIDLGSTAVFELAARLEGDGVGAVFETDDRT